MHACRLQISMKLTFLVFCIFFISIQLKALQYKYTEYFKIFCNKVAVPLCDLVIYFRFAVVHTGK